MFKNTFFPRWYSVCTIPDLLPSPPHEDCKLLWPFLEYHLRNETLISVILHQLGLCFFSCSQTESIRNCQPVSLLRLIFYWASLCARNGARRHEFLVVGLVQKGKTALLGRTLQSILTSRSWARYWVDSCQSLQTCLEPFLFVRGAALGPRPCFDDLLGKGDFLAIEGKLYAEGCSQFQQLSLFFSGRRDRGWLRTVERAGGVWRPPLWLRFYLPLTRVYLSSVSFSPL